MISQSETTMAAPHSHTLPLNFTPHKITVVFDNDEVVIPSSGIARLTTKPQVRLEDVSAQIGLPIFTPQDFTGVTGLPTSESKFVNVIVSMPVAEYLHDTRWLGHIFSPDSGPDSAVRDADGNIKAVRRLVMYQ